MKYNDAQLKIVDLKPWHRAASELTMVSLISAGIVGALEAWPTQAIYKMKAIYGCSKMAGQSERCPTSICSLIKVRWPNHHDTWSLPKKENKATREAQRVFSAFMWMIGRKVCLK